MAFDSFIFDGSVQASRLAQLYGIAEAFYFILSGHGVGLSTFALSIWLDRGWEMASSASSKLTSFRRIRVASSRQP